MNRKSISDDVPQRVMHAANTLRQCVPVLVESYLDGLPDEADGNFETLYYENLPSEIAELFDELMGLCQRYKLDRQADITGKAWRGDIVEEGPADEL
jgi:hypothetical protein